MLFQYLRSYKEVPIFLDPEKKTTKRTKNKKKQSKRQKRIKKYISQSFYRRYCFQLHYASLAFLSVTDICAAAGLSCGYTCDNSTGTFVCVCPSGYELEANQENCTGINPKHYVMPYVQYSSL